MAITKITTEVIADGAITSSHLASGAVSASSLTGITTDNVSEGSTNVYHTAARARGSLSVTGGGISYDSGTGVIQIASIPNASLANSSLTVNSNSVSLGGSVTLDTDDIGEGSTNLYFTNARAQSAISGGTGVTVSGGTISIGQDVATSSTPTFGNITTTGYIAGPATFTIDPAAVGDNTGTVVIAGNLQVDGTTTTINSTTMTVDDLNIVLASGAANASAANGAGITVDGSSATLTYVSTTDSWTSNKLFISDSGGADVAQIRANYGSGNYLDIKHNLLNAVTSGGQSFSIQYGGTSALTIDSNRNATFAGTISSGAITSSGNITGSNLSVSSTNWIGFGDYGERISGNNSNSSLTFSTNATQALLLDASQNATFTGSITGTKADFITSSTTDYVLRLTDSGVAAYDVIFPDTSTYQLTTNTTSNKTFKLLNDGTGTFNLDVEGSISSGGLSIAASSPNLSVQGNSATDASLTLTSAGITSWALRNESTDSALYFTQDGTTRVKLSSGGDISFYEDTGASAKLFWDSSSESLSIGTTGSTTDRRFQVSSTGPSTATTQFGIVVNPTYPTNVTNNVYNLYTGPNLATGTTLTNLYNIYLEANGYPSSTVTNSYGLYQSGTNDKNYFAGNVGILNTNPDKMLTLGTNSDSTNVGYIRLRGHNTLEGNIYKSASYGIHMDTNSNNQGIRIDGGKLVLGITGNVGIGTENPDRKVSIIGNSTSNGQYPLSLDATNTDYTLEFKRNGTSEWWIAQSAGSFRIHENTVGDHFTVLAGGNVGIGTNNPAGPLEIYAAEPRIHLNRQNAFSWNIWVGNGTTFGNSIFNIAEGTTSKFSIAHTTGYVAIGGSGAFSGTPENTLSLVHDGHGLGFDYVSSLPRTAGLYTSSTALTQTAYGDLNIKARSDYGGYYGIGLFTASSNGSPVKRLTINSTGTVTHENAGSIERIRNNWSQGLGSYTAGQVTQMSQDTVYRHAAYGMYELGTVTTRGFGQYVDFKTNLTSDNVMFMFYFTGYLYNRGTSAFYGGGYTYNSGGPIVIAKDTGTGSVVVGPMYVYDLYRSSAGNLCVKIYGATTSYDEGRVNVFFMPHGSGFDTMRIIDAHVTNSTTNYY